MPRNWNWGKKRESGYRSKLEEQVAAELTKKKVKFKYESVTLSYGSRVYGGSCLDCNGKRVVSLRHYKPDFILESGTLIEVKGRFTSRDRTKILAVRISNPDTILVLYFGANNLLRKGGDKRYSDWCEEHGIDYSIGTIPKRWYSNGK